MMEDLLQDYCNSFSSLFLLFSLLFWLFALRALPIFYIAPISNNRETAGNGLSIETHYKFLH